MSKGHICKVCECIGTVYTCMNSWKEPFNPYNSSIWIFSLFWLLNWFQACFQLDTIVVSCHRHSSHIVYACYTKNVHQVMNWSYTQKFIELWTDHIHKSSSSYEWIKNKQVTVLLSNQKARRQYTLIL
jgi:hypothetical protein